MSHVGFNKIPHFKKTDIFHCCLSGLTLTVHWISFCLPTASHCALVTASLSTAGSLLTLDWAQPAGPAPPVSARCSPHYAEYKHQSVWRGEKTGEKIQHPSVHPLGPSDPIMTMYLNYKLCPMCRFNVDIGKILGLQTLTELLAHAQAGPGTSS